MPVNKLHYWLRLLALFGFTLTTALVGLPILLGGLATLGLVYAPCNDNGKTPGDYGVQGEEVTIKAEAGGSFQGYFIPGANGATVIIPPTGSQGRSGRLQQAAMLAEHGYAVLTFESRRCAGMGPISLGYSEVREVADAFDYLTTRPDVDLRRVGVYGFSTAGATAVMAAAQLPQLQAVVAEGGYGDFVENALGHHERYLLVDLFLRLYCWATRVTYRIVVGVSLEKLSPVSVIKEIAPRPVLLIYGNHEASLAGGLEQKEAADANADLWIVDGASHGTYMTVAPQAYEERIVTFFNEALLEDVN